MDSLKKRYFYKLSTNLVGFAVSLVTQAVIPRGLGPGAYGDFNFLTNFFTQVVAFFDTGTSLGFYTKLSQRPKEFKLMPFYLYFIVAVTVAILALVTIICSTGTHTRLWPNQGIFYVYLAAFFGIFSWIAKIMNQITDAYGLTVAAELSKIYQKMLGLIIIILLFGFGKLFLASFFYYNYLMLFLLIIVFFHITKKAGYFIGGNWVLRLDDIKRYGSEFYNYAHPLLTFSLVGVVAGIFDRWLLQVYGGSIEQGFFGLSYQIGIACFVFTGAMTPLIMREFSVAYNNKDMRTMADLFRRHVPLLYSITAFLACFIAVNADKVTLIMGGGKFKAAALAVSIMAFFPIHQTYGQLSGSIFYATGQTKLYRNAGIVMLLAGIPVTYFLIAPKAMWGLNAGATGLAIKTVIVNIVSVNVLLYFNARFLKLSFMKYLAHQVLSVASFLTCALIITLAINKVSWLGGNAIIGFIAGGILYTLLAAGLVLYVPRLAGIRKDDIRYILEKIKIAGM